MPKVFKACAPIITAFRIIRNCFSILIDITMSSASSTKIKFAGTTLLFHFYFSLFYARLDTPLTEWSVTPTCRCGYVIRGRLFCDKTG